MKLHQCVTLIAIALYGQNSLADVNELTMLQYTSAAKKTTIGEQANTHLAFSAQLSVVSDQGQVISHTISHSGADYIKVHFAKVQLTGNAKLVVRNEANTERYEYSADNMRAATQDSKAGDDGVHSFSAMSVSNDSVIIDYYPDSATSAQQSEFGVIDSYFYGTESLTSADLNSSDDLSPLSTCGINERKDVQCWANSHPTEFERSRPVARLVIGGRSLCTGWRVGSDNKLFTNNHCVETASELASTEVWFNYQHTSCNGSSRETVVKVTGKELFKTDYTLDYTLFSVNNFASISQFGYLGLDVRNAVQGERIYIPQHGAGNPKELAIESDQDSNGLCQVNAPSINGRGSNTDIGYNCDTIGGSSGSPVLAASSNSVIALHHLGGCYNKGAKISQIWPQVSSYFNGTVPIGDNNGNNPPPPTARFTYDCDLTQCRFDGSDSSSSATINSYNWNFGNSQTDSGVTSVHTFASAGTYDVSLTVQDSNNRSNTLTKQVIVSGGTPAEQELIKGQVLNGLSGSTNQESFYYIDLPNGASNLKVSLSGGSGDADLYVKKGSKPTSSDYDCRPFRNGNNESCTVDLAEGRYFVMLKGYRSYAGVSLVADYTTNTTPPPTDGDSTEIIDRAFGFPGFWNRYDYTVPAGKTSITVTTSGAIGDMSLYVKIDGNVSEQQFDCQSTNTGSNESCTVAARAGQMLQIGLLGVISYDWVKVVATAN